jgi:hypothetical protein
MSSNDANGRKRKPKAIPDQSPPTTTRTNKREGSQSVHIDRRFRLRRPNRRHIYSTGRHRWRRSHHSEHRIYRRYNDSKYWETIWELFSSWQCQSQVFDALYLDLKEDEKKCRALSQLVALPLILLAMKNFRQAGLPEFWRVIKLLSWTNSPNWRLFIKTSPSSFRFKAWRQ